VTLTNVTISGNTASFTGTGAGGVKGGGIFSTSNATAAFANLNILGNKATATGAGFIDGAGLFSEKSDTTFSGNVDNNTASDTGTGVVDGGGIFTSAASPLTITPINATTASTISGNSITATSTVEGGGIYASGAAHLNISTATISGNTATSSGGEVLGGGIYSGTGPLTLTASTIAANAISSSSAHDVLGGGIYTAGMLTATNDTIWANSATNTTGSTAEGGGIFLVASSKAALIDDTVGFNTASGASSSNGGGIFVSTGATLNLVNTIVFDPSGPSGSPDVFGTIANSQNDLFGSPTTGAGYTITNNLGGNIVSANPGLGILTNNGGPTETVSDAGSLAVDAGTPSSLIGTIPGTDQRGAPRPDVAGTNPDIGAFEFQATPTPTTVATTISGLSVSDSFGLFSQTEKVSGTVSDDGTPVSAGSVTISDAGQTQTVGGELQRRLQRHLQFQPVPGVRLGPGAHRQRLLRWGHGGHHHLRRQHRLRGHAQQHLQLPVPDPPTRRPPGVAGGLTAAAHRSHGRPACRSPEGTGDRRATRGYGGRAANRSARCVW
jgi:hypothetical protein